MMEKPIVIPILTRITSHLLFLFVIILTNIL